MTHTLLPTTVVGSYPQPDWLIDRERLKTFVPRIRAADLWRVPAEFLEEAQNDATLVAIRDMERAGLDIITDGEIRRESYSNHFANSLEGVDIDNPASIVGRAGKAVMVPRITGRIRRVHAVENEPLAFLKRNTDRRIKITLPGPFTMAHQAQDETYGDVEALAMDFAVALNEELLELQTIGPDVIQLDEPWLQAFPDDAARFGVRVIDRALQGVTCTKAVHLCFGYAQFVHDKKGGYAYLGQLADSVADQISIEAAQPDYDLGILRDFTRQSIILGVINLGDPEVEAETLVAARIRRGLEHVPAERLIAAPDCGMKYLSRASAFGKLKALSAGAAIVRRTIT